MSNNPGKASRGSISIAATIAIVVLLVGIAGLLAVQNWRLKKELAANQAAAEPVAAAPASPVAPVLETQPAPEPPPTAKASIEKSTIKKPAPKKAASGNYTRPSKDLNPPPATRPEPESVARVAPTDVSPVDPTRYPAAAAPAPPAAPAKISATIPSGTILSVRLLDTLDSDRNQAGDRFRASLEEPIVSDGKVVVPRGTTVEGRVVEAQQAGRVKGVAEMTLELSQIRLANGDTAVLDTGTVMRQGQTSTGEDAAKVGAGAAIGAVIGAIGGGGKGAAIGAATGAGAGTAGVLLTRGKPLILSQETVLSFQLNAPVTVEVTPGATSEPVYTPPERQPSQQGDWGSGRPRLRRRD
jgi:hypothetical protein